MGVKDGGREPNRNIILTISLFHVVCSAFCSAFCSPLYAVFEPMWLLATILSFIWRTHKDRIWDTFPKGIVNLKNVSFILCINLLILLIYMCSLPRSFAMCNLWEIHPQFWIWGPTATSHCPPPPPWYAVSTPAALPEIMHTKKIIKIRTRVKYAKIKFTQHIPCRIWPQLLGVGCILTGCELLGPNPEQQAN